MGKLFELIADEALEVLDDYYIECHVCDRTDVDLYPYQGKREDGEDIYAACSDCILAGNLRHIGDYWYIETVRRYLKQLNLNEKEQEEMATQLMGKYNKTPGIPMFMQDDDRPLCCNDITKFIGYPTDFESLCEIYDNGIYWEGEVKNNEKENYNFRIYGEPESLTEVASHQCQHCGTKYFTFQFT